jgi:cytochrome P450
LTQTSLPASARTSNLKTPSGPRGHFLLGHVRELQHDPLPFTLKLAHEYGDVARIRLLSTSAYYVSHPDGIKQILQKGHLNYDRNVFFYESLRPFLANGLLLSDGELWRHQRRLMQPAFHKQRIASMATQVVKVGDAFLKRWEKLAHQNEPLSIHREMLSVTLSVAGMTLFGLDLAAERNPMGQAFQTLVQALADYVLLPFPPLSVPTSRNRCIRANLLTLDALVHDLIRERREQKTDTGDLLSLLLASDEDGSSMSDKQLRDEIVNLLFAGHETTAGTLTWVWYMLSQHPEVEQRLWEETEAVLHGEPPTVVHLSRLPYVRMIIDEVLRLYPITASIPRRTRINDTICGYHVPANHVIFANIYAAHRHPAYWEQPETFNPERFSPDHPCEGVHTAYFPFGGGPHICMGNNLALMVAQILLTMITQRYRLELVPGQSVEPVQRLTIRPRDGLLMFLKTRK